MVDPPKKPSAAAAARARLAETRFRELADELNLALASGRFVIAIFRVEGERLERYQLRADFPQGDVTGSLAWLAEQLGARSFSGPTSPSRSA